MAEGLQRRVVMHAALGEPKRLMIIDRLAVADASPGELSAVLGLSTNLLAHHLGVLEDAGLVQRVPSEGDRRRSYIQLVLDDPLVTRLVVPSQIQPSPRIVFVCTHNSARSQLAAAAWARVSSLPATSAGTHPARRVHPRAVRIARRHGLRLGPTGPTNVSDVVQPDDLIVAVCDNAHEELPPTTPRLHWSVADPGRADTDSAFEDAYRHITERVDRLVHAISPASTGTRSYPPPPLRKEEDS